MSYPEDLDLERLCIVILPGINGRGFGIFRRDETSTLGKIRA